MGRFVRDDAVRDMARRLAEARRTTVTEAGRQALERELAELQRDRAQRERLIRESLTRLDAMPDYDSTKMICMTRLAHPNRPALPDRADRR